MNLNRVDWTNAQNMLIKLVQVLSPLTVRTIPASFFMTRRFSIPPTYLPEDYFPPRASIRLLTSLSQVQKEVEEWIGGGPSLKAEAREPVKGAAKMVMKDVSKRQKGAVSGKDVSTEKGGALRAQLNLARQTIPNELQNIALGKQAKELIHQVQQAIGMLSSSSYIQEPKEVPLRETLKKLKPNLDRIIDTLADSRENGPPKAQSFRHALPVSPREEIIRKLRFFSEENSFATQQVVTEKVDQSNPDQAEKGAFCPEKISQKSQAPKKKGGKQMQSGGDEICPDLKKAADMKLAPPIIAHEKSEEAPNGPKTEPRPVALPAAPMLMEPKRLTMNRKKKRRKGFWFKDEDDSKED